MKTLDLITPFPWGAQTITQIEIREPNGSEFIRLGEPYLNSIGDDGRVANVEDNEVIRAYCEMLIVTPARLPLDLLGLADSMRLKDAVLDFFIIARRAGLKGAPKPSSASSDGSMPEVSDEPA